MVQTTDSVMYVHTYGPHDSLRTEFYLADIAWKHYDSELLLIENDLRFGYAYADALDTTGTSGYYQSFLRNSQTATSKKLLAEWIPSGC